MDSNRFEDIEKAIAEAKIKDPKLSDLVDLLGRELLNAKLPKKYSEVIDYFSDICDLAIEDVVCVSESGRVFNLINDFNGLPRANEVAKKEQVKFYAIKEIDFNRIRAFLRGHREI